jgi:hypothetical protein
LRFVAKWDSIAKVSRKPVRQKKKTSNEKNNCQNREKKLGLNCKGLKEACDAGGVRQFWFFFGPVYISIRQHTSAYRAASRKPVMLRAAPVFVLLYQHTSAHASTRQHTPAYASIRQHTPAYASILRKPVMLRAA